MSEERERWQELDEKATPGPWIIDRENLLEYGWRVRRDTDTGGWTAWTGVHDDDNSAEDAEFIAAARTAWPAAERECEQLRALLREAREYIADEWSENCTIIHQTDGLLDGGQPHG